MLAGIDKDVFLYTIEKLKQEMQPFFVQFTIKEGVLYKGNAPATLDEIIIPFFQNRALINLTRVAGFYENNGKIYAKAHGEEMAELKDVSVSDFNSTFNSHLT